MIVFAPVASLYWDSPGSLQLPEWNPGGCRRGVTTPLRLCFDAHGLWGFLAVTEDAGDKHGFTQVLLLDRYLYIKHHKTLSGSLSLSLCNYLYMGDTAIFRYTCAYYFSLIYSLCMFVYYWKNINQYIYIYIYTYVIIYIHDLVLHIHTRCVHTCHTYTKTDSDPFLNALVLIPVPRFGAWCVSLMTASAAPHGKWMSTHTRKAAQWMKRLLYNLVNVDDIDGIFLSCCVRCPGLRMFLLGREHANWPISSSRRVA